MIQTSVKSPLSEDTNHPVVLTPLHLTPAILTTITLQVDKDTTLLRFLLSQDALYRVATHGNHLVLILENARLVGSVPPLNMLNSAVKDITMVNRRDGNLEMNLTLNDGVDLSRLELNESQKLPELQLDLLSTGLPDATSSNAAPHVPPSPQPVDSIIKVRTDISMSDQYQEALKLSTEGHSHDAIKMLTFLLEKDPDYADVRESLASLLIAQGNLARAGQLLQSGLEQRPFYPAYVQLKAKMLVSQGKIKEAMNLLQKAPPTITVDPGYHAFIAALYQRQGQAALAEKLYEQLLAVQPNNATWWMGLGIALESLGKSTLAREAYVRARDSDHINPELKVFAQSRVNHLQQ